jgi:two-component system, chemotaxis family, sensor kinase Cph1
VHIEYLKNMNVGASMSISLRVNGQLWGLIACHHHTSRLIPYATRAACEVFGQIASREIATKQEALALAERVETKTVQTQFFDLIAREKSVADALLRYMPALLEFMSASGAAISLGDQLHLTGHTPDRTAVAELVQWLHQEGMADPIFEFDRLGELFPPAQKYQDCASGLLAVKLSRVQAHYVVWFRPEVVRTVSWAGKPEKTIDEKNMRLHPRKSFAAWQETVKGRSLPWRNAEIEGAAELRLALNALVIRRTEQLLQLNAELERKNSDLNSFAYIASHDLKEPLRGIHHFSQFLLEDHGQVLGEEGLRKAEMIRTLAGHTNELLDSLSHFSKVGRMELHLREVDLNSLLGEVLLSLKVGLDEQRVTIRRLRPLPTIRCDSVLTREIFANLIANAARYNDKEMRSVEITWREPIPEKGERGPVLIVHDNGIGIRERNHDLVFQMFWRLNKNITGSGAGLAIVKSIVERHGGRIWVDSHLGEGSTFLFTLE